MERNVTAGARTSRQRNAAPGGGRISADLRNTLPVAPFAALATQIGARALGSLTYQVAVIVANAATRTVLAGGLSLAANAALTRGIAVAIGPAGIAVTMIWLAIAALGPSYKALVPAVFQVAAIRQLVLWSFEEET